MPQTKPAKAVIYARVSNPKQVREGDGLASQETRCREYAKYKGYEVVNIFADNITGKLVERPAMVEMLGFLRQHKRKTPYVVIIDDISRFARNLRGHLELRSLLRAAFWNPLPLSLARIQTVSLLRTFLPASPNIKVKKTVSRRKTVCARG